MMKCLHVQLSILAQHDEHIVFFMDCYLDCDVTFEYIYIFMVITN